MFCYRLLHMDTSVLAEQQRLTSVLCGDYPVVKTYLEWCMIGMDGEKVTGKSALSGWVDDVYIYRERERKRKREREIGEKEKRLRINETQKRFKKIEQS